MVANEEALARMKQYENIPKKPITNIAFYWLLANPSYQRQFNYFPVALPSREKYIVDDDSEDENNCE